MEVCFNDTIDIIDTIITIDIIDKVIYVWGKKIPRSTALYFCAKSYESREVKEVRIIKEFGRAWKLGKIVNIDRKDFWIFFHHYIP